MKKYLSLLLVSVFCLTALFGCGKNVKPGDIDGYDEGETYLSIWVHIIEETPEGQAYLKFQRQVFRGRRVHSEK